jgi:hypothetical protein
MSTIYKEAFVDERLPQILALAILLCDKPHRLRTRQAHVQWAPTSLRVDAAEVSVSNLHGHREHGEHTPSQSEHLFPFMQGHR